MPKGRSPRELIFMVCLQETADFVSVEIVWLGQSPGHRRLRFSFQFNDVKDPTGFRRPHCFAPVVGGGGLLEAGLVSVNRSFRTSPPHPLTPEEAKEFGAKITPGCGGATLSRSAPIRLRLGKIPIYRGKARGFSAPSGSPHADPARAGGGYVWGGPSPVNRRLCTA